MSRSWWTKLVLLIAFIVTAVVYTVPTIFNLNPETTKWPYKQKINLGLDLQGGLYMVLGVDFNKVFKDMVARQGERLQAQLVERGVAGAKVAPLAGSEPTDPAAIVEFTGANPEQVRTVIKEFEQLRVTDTSKPGQIEIHLTAAYRDDIRDKTINQSIEVIRNRIDEFGVAEPSISSQGSDRIVVELPGIREVQRAKDLIGRTAKLEFKIADDKAMSPDQLHGLVQELETKNGITFKEGGKFSDYVAKLNEAAKGRIPEGREISFERVHAQGADAATREDAGLRIPYLLISKADVTGDDLQDAVVGISPENGRPEVNFQMNPRGATLFGKLTEANVGNRLAIVLDNIVHSAPVINSKISDRGQITLGRTGGDAAMKEARDLAIVLRAGALPAQLDFQEQRVVGPTLGQDSITRGARAGVIGCILVFIFMIFYYRMSGVVASVSLMLNALFLLAILIGMDATLTLPGMAGIALTIGMAVDSNVLIFERIRDELQEGKAVPSAVSAGFQKAFGAIFDANITHGIIAAVLMSYGTGPIRGFAVSLFIGIITTLFCAVTVCKLFFDGYLGMAKAPREKLSI